jgi:DNA-binding transcriptional regulator YiaG
MGKLEKSIKSEIVRLARTELRKVSVPLARDVWSLKRAVSQIRKTVLPLQQFTARQQKELQNRKISLEVTPEEMKISRFSPRLVQSLRKHLGLSQRELAILTGVTIGAVQKWESGKFKPKEEKKRRMVALRKLRRKDVRRLLTG